MSEAMTGTGPLLIRKPRALPHWYRDQAIYFITYRLNGSVPRRVAQRMCWERDAFIQRCAHLDDEQMLAATKRFWFGRLEAYLHTQPGILSVAANAEEVLESLRYHCGRRHDPIAWCVMPNHVHVVTRLRPLWKIGAVVQSWKRRSAREINKKRRKRGKLWQKDYFDRLVRDRNELKRIIRYILENPAKAGLQNWKWVGVGDSELMDELGCGEFATE